MYDNSHKNSTLLGTWMVSKFLLRLKWISWKKIKIFPFFLLFWVSIIQPISPQNAFVPGFHLAPPMSSASPHTLPLAALSCDYTFDFKQIYKFISRSRLISWSLVLSSSCQWIHSTQMSRMHLSHILQMPQSPICKSPSNLVFLSSFPLLQV